MDEQALSRARLSLQGLALGDAFGEMYMGLYPRFGRESALPPAPWRWTDDTHMAISIVENLARHGEIEPDSLARAFAERFMSDPDRGYAGGAARLLRALARGEDWRTAAPALFKGGSYGNGGAMRAAPIGAYFSGDPERAAAEARKSAMVTHAHPDGQAGAMAVAAAAALAAGSSVRDGAGLLQAVLNHVPNSLTRDGVAMAATIPAEDVVEAIRTLGTGQLVSSQDTVPFCLWVAAHYRTDFEEALWTTASGLGDCDTTCAIAGGVVALACKALPDDWLVRVEPVPILG